MFTTKERNKRKARTTCPSSFTDKKGISSTSLYNTNQRINIMSTKEYTRCAIIGSGPAGYTAAIYASRAT